jgi:hypothetical protein
MRRDDAIQKAKREHRHHAIKSAISSFRDLDFLTRRKRSWPRNISSTMKAPSLLSQVICSLLSIDLVTFIYGFSATPSSNGSADPALTRSNRPNFHQVLEQAGKTVFRPGGTEATNTIHAWADD